MHGLIFGTKSHMDEQQIFHSKGFRTLVDIPARTFGAYKIATHLRDIGWDIEVIDFFYAFSFEEICSLLQDRITEETKFIGFSIFYKQHDQGDNDPRGIQFYTGEDGKLNQVLRYIHINFPWVTTVCGAQKLKSLMKIKCHYHIIGFGENAIVELTNHLIGKGPHPETTTVKNLYNVPSSSYDIELNVIDSTRHYPAFPKRSAKITYEERDYIQPNETLNIEFSRGCKFKCAFCSYNPLGVKGDMTRCNDDVYEELMENYEKWGCTHYIVSDETFNDTSEKLDKFAEVCKRLPFQPTFHGFVRMDLMASRGERDWDNMLEMGFVGHHYGVETLNHEAGKAIRKGMHPDKIKDYLVKTREYFVKNSPVGYYSGVITMIAGLPHESHESLKESQRWLFQNWPDKYFFIPLVLTVPEKLDKNRFDPNSDFDNLSLQHGYEFQVYNDRDTDWAGVKRGMSDEDKYHRGMIKWIHPSKEYDYVDMLKWVSTINFDRVHKISMWSLPMFTQTNKNLSDTFMKGVDWDMTDTNVILDFVHKYKELKLGRSSHKRIPVHKTPIKNNEMMKKLGQQANKHMSKNLNVS